jgi:hypothetical protein
MADVRLPWRLPDGRPWGGRGTLVIPPNSANAWVELAIWEMWMGMVVCLVSGLGAYLIVTSPSHILAVPDLTNCYAPPPVVTPCERMVYRGGMLNTAFVALCGLVLVGFAVWMLWELWSAVEPKPITDDFLRLLNESFGLEWRNPLKWPWARLFWAYGFTIVGAVLTAGAGLAIWTFIVSANPSKPLTPRIETSQRFTLGP